MPLFASIRTGFQNYFIYKSRARRSDFWWWFGFIVVGAVIALEALFAGPICGASMNPARSFAPAVVSGQLDALWIYLLAPVMGAQLAVPACRCVQAPGCCRATNAA